MIKYFICFLQFPDSEEEWLAIADKYENRWQLPHCVGAIDLKHISILKPQKSGSMYFNYKGFFSAVLLALVDADCNFIYIEAGAQGRVSDGGVFANSGLAEGLENNSLHLPSAAAMPNASNLMLPYFIVGDDAFPLKKYLIKPFSKRDLSEEEMMANYRISRAWRTSENAFGILANVFRVFHTPMHSSPNKVVKVILAACILHNYRRNRLATAPVADKLPVELVDTHLTKIKEKHTNVSNEAKYVRDNLKHYFMTDGKVEWQSHQSKLF